MPPLQRTELSRILAAIRTLAPEQATLADSSNIPFGTGVHRPVRRALRRHGLALIAVAAATVVAGCEGPPEEKGGVILDVTVHGSVAPYRTKFTGHYVYVHEGQRYRRSLSGTGNLNEIVRGDHIAYVVVQRTSEKGVIGLVVTENQQIVYDSGISDTNDLLVYEGE